MTNALQCAIILNVKDNRKPKRTVERENKKMIKKMTIQELIATLEKIDDKNMIVNFHSISNNDTQKEIIRVFIEKARNTATIIIK